MRALAAHLTVVLAVSILAPIALVLTACSSRRRAALGDARLGLWGVVHSRDERRRLRGNGAKPRSRQRIRRGRSTRVMPADVPVRRDQLDHQQRRCTDDAGGRAGGCNQPAVGRLVVVFADVAERHEDQRVGHDRLRRSTSPRCPIPTRWKRRWSTTTSPSTVRASPSRSRSGRRPGSLSRHRSAPPRCIPAARSPTGSP